MEWRGPIRKINLELPEDMHAEVKSAAPKRPAKTLKNAYIEGMTAWLERSSAPDDKLAPREQIYEPLREPADTPASQQAGHLVSSRTTAAGGGQENAEWHRLLEAVLKHPTRAVAIKHNLKAFAEGLNEGPPDAPESMLSDADMERIRAEVITALELHRREEETRGEHQTPAWRGKGTKGATRRAPRKRGA